MFESVFRCRRLRSLKATVESWNGSEEHSSVADLIVETSSGTDPLVPDNTAGGPYPRATLTEVGPLIAWMDLEANGHTAVGSRAGVRLTARLGPPRTSFPPWGTSRDRLHVDGLLNTLFAEDADEWELVIDLTSGVLVRGVSRAAGKTVASLEIVDALFDPGS